MAAVSPRVLKSYITWKARSGTGKEEVKALYKRMGISKNRVITLFADGFEITLEEAAEIVNRYWG